ncbi:MAG TPA: hypothetical protein VFP58_11265, partial [Candidatus Eisenbacteria bacterium]|nr:hypothetical protein [Candidatus Eisenbacteria bacterium]
MEALDAVTDQGVPDHAYPALELPTVLEAIAGRSHSVPGRELVARLQPHATIENARASQDLYRDLLACAESGDAPPASAPPDLRPELERLSLAGATLRGEELWRIGTLLIQTRAIVTWHGRTRRETPGLTPLVQALDPLESLQRELARALEPTGEVRDEASPALAKIRRSIRTLRDRLAARMESILRSLATPESFVTLREDRYVIAIPSGNRRALPGTIMGHSGSGASLFVEPREAAEGNSELAELALDEAREVERILRELSSRAHAHA